MQLNTFLFYSFDIILDVLHSNLRHFSLLKCCLQARTSYFITGAVSGLLITRIGLTSVTLMSSVLVVAGLVMSFFATSIYFLYISVGIITGMFLLPLCILHKYDVQAIQIYFISN